MSLRRSYNNAFEKRFVKEVRCWGNLQQKWLEHPEDDEWDGGKRAVRHGQMTYVDDLSMPFSMMPQLWKAMRSVVEEMRRISRASKRRRDETTELMGMRCELHVDWLFS